MITTLKGEDVSVTFIDFEAVPSVHGQDLVFTPKVKKVKVPSQDFDSNAEGVELKASQSGPMRLKVIPWHNVQGIEVYDSSKQEAGYV